MEIEFPKTDIRQAVPKEENCCYTKAFREKETDIVKREIIRKPFYRRAVI